MNHPQPRPTPGQTAAPVRPVCVPRPAQRKAVPALPSRSAPLVPQAPRFVQPSPPPLPRRPDAKPKASPPPLPETVLLADADLVDDEVEFGRASRPTSLDVEIEPVRVSRPTSIDVEIEPVRVSRPTSLDVEIEPARASRPTSFDVEIDCVERSEPPPASRPQRKRAWLALISGVCLLGASGALFFGRSAALHASRVIDATVSAGAARTPAMLTNAALETKTSPAPVQTRAPAPNPASNGKARSKPPIHTQRAQAPVVSGSSKKPPEPVRSRHAQRKAT